MGNGSSCDLAEASWRRVKTRRAVFFFKAASRLLPTASVHSERSECRKLCTNNHAKEELVEVSRKYRHLMNLEDKMEHRKQMIARYPEMECIKPCARVVYLSVFSIFVI